jgi:hypothetical protein
MQHINSVVGDPDYMLSVLYSDVLHDSQHYKVPMLVEKIQSVATDSILFLSVAELCVKNVLVHLHCETIRLVIVFGLLCARAV